MKKKIIIKSLASLSLIAMALNLGGCSHHMRAQEIQTDLTLREMRSEIEDFKYQLNRFEVELQIVEGKADSQNTAMNLLRSDFSKLNKNESDLIETTLLQYDRKIQKIESMEDKLKSDLLKVKEHTNEILTSLAQFKAKVDGNENHLVEQSQYIQHLKTSLESIMKFIDQPAVDGAFYVVKPGDSLAKLAKENNVSVEKLKEINNLTTDLIIVGQKLRLK
jgi:LysM repeat protein